MYIDGLGFELLGSFVDHDGFDGAFVGHRQHLYHLEFTHRRGTSLQTPPHPENLLVFYLPESKAWKATCSAMRDAGFKNVPAYNPYWDVHGETFQDVDGYRLVLHNRGWDL